MNSQKESQAERPDLSFDAGHRALLIDNYEPTIEILSSLFDCLDLSLDVASSTREALCKLSQTFYDLVLLDDNLPPANGLIACAAIRAFERASKRPPASIIGITTWNGIHDVALCKAAGMDDCIPRSAIADYIQVSLTSSVASVDVDHLKL